MALLSFPTPNLDFTPRALTERYRPATVAGFAGLEDAKKALGALIRRPYESHWLLTGESGTGKTSAALAVCEAIAGELHHIPSQECTLERLQRVRRSCQYVPAAGYQWHVILIDEGDRMSEAAQIACLSMLDGTDTPPRTIIFVTCNDTTRLETRFLSRLRKLKFSNYRIQAEAAELLERIWSTEAPADAKRPNFAAMIKEANGNVREALMDLEVKLLCL